MNSNIRVNFLENIESEYELALAWLENQGVRVNASRLMHIYKKIIKSKKENLSPDEVWASLELYEVHELYKTLSKSSKLHKNVHINLKKIINGQLFLKEEVISGSSNNGRNYMFELSMVEFFVKNGIDVQFDSDADFNVKTLLGNIFFECKRPALKSTIISNTLEAFKQINARGTAYDSGVVCISLSRLVWDKMKDGVLISKLNDIKTHILDLVHEELEAIKISWNFNKHKKVILIISDIKIPFVNYETGELVLFLYKDFNFKYWEDHLLPPWNSEVITRANIATSIINTFENKKTTNI